MSRYIIVIRKPDQPTCYYLSRNGFRCYDHRNVAVMHSLAEAQEERDHFASLMTDFRLTIERLPPRVSVKRGLLCAVPA